MNDNCVTGLLGEFGLFRFLLLGLGILVKLG